MAFTPLVCQTEIWTQVCRTAGRHATTLNELRRTLLSYAASYWPTPNPYWAAPHPIEPPRTLTELRRTLNQCKILYILFATSLCILSILLSSIISSKDTILKSSPTPHTSTKIGFTSSLFRSLYVHLKPNSWTYNFVEVSGHNPESSQAWGFCMDFLNHREGGMGFYQVFLLSPLQCTVTEL